MKKWVKILLIGFLFTLLVGVRFFETYFYDPLLNYFEQNYLHTSLPEMQKARLLFNILIRFSLNMLLSISIIWVAFQKKSLVKFSLYFYVITFIILTSILYVLISTTMETSNLLLFYVRRFLIQPLFILLLLPAFYYQEHIGD